MTLKIEHLTQTVNSSPELRCCFDVSKASLSLYREGYRAGVKTSLLWKILQVVEILVSTTCPLVLLQLLKPDEVDRRSVLQPFLDTR